MKNIVIREYFPGDSTEDKDKFLPAFLDIWNASGNLKYLSFTMKPFDHQIIKIRIKNHKNHIVIENIEPEECCVYSLNNSL